MAPLSARLRPFEIASVSIEDTFWAARLETNRKVTLPYVYRRLKKTGPIDALHLDRGLGRPKAMQVAWDSDVAKWIEGASYTLATHPDPKVEALLEQVVRLFAAAQQPDGYLNSYFTAYEPKSRFTNLRDRHELYCAGHLMEAAVAHYRATGSRALLNVTCRYGDQIASVFGTEARKKRGYPGHEEIELALVKLYRVTGRRQYLELAKFFLDERGKRPHYFDIEANLRGERPEDCPQCYTYFQAHRPVRRQSQAVGHAVRAVYLYSGMADVAAETADAELLGACKRLWESITSRKMYLTGGIGSRHRGEAFGEDYELPNESAYAETCAAIGLVLFAHRMLQIERDAKYADVMERALYNGVLSGVALDGDRFFYVNPLASGGGHHRKDWFGVSCCPPNLARLLASLGQYAYSAGEKDAYVHLYIAGSGTAEVAGRPVTLRQETNYPWDGQVKITVEVDGPIAFTLRLRIPGWCKRHRLKVNGKPAAARITKGYVRIRRRWREGDTVCLSLAMPVRRVVAHPLVAADAGKVALQRGPIVYCLEQCDHAADVRSIALPANAKLTLRFDKTLLGGCMAVQTTGRTVGNPGRKSKLYRDAGRAKTRPARIKAIPYCLWDNRRPGPMTVWLPTI